MKSVMEVFFVLNQKIFLMFCEKLFIQYKKHKFVILYFFQDDATWLFFYKFFNASSIRNDIHDKDIPSS